MQTMPAPEQKKPAMRPYLAAAKGFRLRRADAAAISRRLAFVVRTMGAADRRLRLHQSAGGARGGGSIRPSAGAPASPASPIDGMPVGIKDIIETVDMPTEMGSPLFAGWRSEKDAACVRALRDAGAVIIGKTVTTEFAASEPRGTRNPWNLAHTPGGSSSGSAASVATRHRVRGARHAGDRLDHASGELLRLRRLQAERERDQPRRQSRLSEPELHRHPRGFAGRCLAGRLRDRRAGRRRCRHARPARAAQRAAAAEAANAGAPAKLPAGTRPPPAPKRSSPNASRG